MKPSTQPWPDCPIRIRSASARATAALARARASSIRPRWAAMIAAGNSPVGRRGRAASGARRLGRVPVGLGPVPRPPFEEAQAPERERLRRSVVPLLAASRSSEEQPACPSSVDRPHQLMARRPRRARRRSGASGSVRSSASASSISARGMPRPARKRQSARGRERAAPEADVVVRAAARTADSLCVEAALDAVAVVHQVREPEVDRRLERVVALRLGERLAVVGDARSRSLPATSASWTRTAARSTPGAAVARARVERSTARPVSPAAGAWRRREGRRRRASLGVGGRGEPERLLRQLGCRLPGRRGRAPTPPPPRGSRRSSRLGLGRREGEVSRAFLRGRRRPPRGGRGASVGATASGVRRPRSQAGGA